MYIPVILGTAREGRQSEKVANFIVKEVAKFEFETELIDIENYRLDATDRSEKTGIAQKWKEKAKRADGFIIVSPEYNFGYPGELKIFVDMIYDEYVRKPFGLVGVSAGYMGGIRMMDQLKLSIKALQGVITGSALFFPKVNDLFDEDGNMLEEEKYQKRTKEFLEDFEWYAKTLKDGRKDGD